MHRRLRRDGRARGRNGPLVALALSVVFAVLGVALVIPMSGPFGLVWTGLAIAFAIASAVRLARDRGDAD
jgi:hypothetical protein